MMNKSSMINKSPMIKCILFDKDGTLVHFQKTWFTAIHNVFRILAKNNEIYLTNLEKITQFDRETMSFDPNSIVIAGASADYAGLLAKAVGEEPSQAFLEKFDRLAYEQSLETLTPIGNPKAVLTQLKEQGFLLGLATNGSYQLAQSHSEKLGITPLLGFICGYDSGFGRKPQGGMVLACASHFNIKPHEIAVVGDTLHDIHMAKDAGAMSIGIASGLTSYETLACEADMVVDDLEALLIAFKYHMGDETCE
jgi:phosphoglycolate phosphatase